MKRILLCAPLAREFKYVLGNFPSLKRWASGDVFSARTASGEVVLLRTGIGTRRSESSLTSLLREFRPDLIVSLGFAGALREGLTAGDLVWASRVFFLSYGASRNEGTELPEIYLPDARKVADRLAAEISVREGCIVTLEDLVTKPEVRKRLPAEIPPPVCDMETFALAGVAARQGIPFFAVRSVSDISAHEIPAELLDIFDESGKILFFRLFGRVLRKPGLIRDMLHLRRDSERAAKSLGVITKSIIDAVD